MCNRVRSALTHWVKCEEARKLICTEALRAPERGQLSFLGLLALVSPSLKHIGALHLSPMPAVLWFFGAWAWVARAPAACCWLFWCMALLMRCRLLQILWGFGVR